MSKAILVAGMHRSGTSATSGALRMCGVSLGSELIPAAADNRLGYWENARAVAIHEQLLERLERSWDDVRALPNGWLQNDAARSAAVQIEELVREEFGGNPIWAVKDPRICRFLPLWKEVLARMGIPAVVLMVARRPSEVAESIQKRNGWMPALSELLWLRHVLEAERHSRDLQRCVVTYDGMLANPREVMFRALERLDVASVSVSQSSAGELEGFISGDERHHRHDPEGVSSTGIAEQAFRLLSSIAMDNEGWGALAELGDAFEASHMADSRYVDALAHSSWKLRQRNQESSEAIAIVRSNLNAQIAWSEQAVLREQELQAALAQAREDFNAQVRWSNEAVEREQRLVEELAQARSNLIGQIRWSEEAVERQQRLEQELRTQASELKLAESVNSSLQAELLTVQGELASVQSDLASVQSDLASVQSDLASAREGLASVLSSLSWKMTAPLRTVARLVSRKSANGSNSR